jgi:hypothetical protein
MDENQQLDIAQKLNQISDALVKRLEALDKLDNAFDKDNDVFDDLLQKIEEAADDNKLKSQTALLAERLTRTKDDLLNNLKDTTQRLEDELGSISDPVQKNALDNALESLNDKILLLDEDLTKNVKDKVEKITKLGLTDKVNIKNLIKSGLDANVLEQIKEVEKNTYETASEVLGASTPDSIKEQIYQKIGYDSNTNKLNLNARDLGTATASITASLLSLGKKLKAMGIDTSLKGLIAAPALALAAPDVSKIKNIPDIFQGFGLQLKGAMTMFAGLNKGLMALPMRMMDFAIKKGLEIKKDNFDFLNNLEELQNKFAGKSGIGKNFDDLNESLRETRRLAYAKGFEFEKRTSLYGALGDDLIRRQIQETADIIKAMGPYSEMMSAVVTRNIKEADERVSDYYYKAKKLMNLSDEDILNLTNRAVALGKSFPDVFHEISKATSDAAKKFGLDFKLMSGDVLTLRKNITDFAHKSADELATVVANVRRMGVSLNDAMSVFSRVDSFETAATTAAQLNQTFGMVIDSMELLKAESPDEILQQYKDAFAMSGKSFETMNRFERSLILQQTGLSDQAAQAIFSLENAGKTYEEVMATVNQKDPTTEQIAHMEEMDHAIQRNYQTMSDYNGMLNMVSKTMNDKLFKENEGLKNSFIGAANAAQGLNHELSQFNMFKKGGTLENSFTPFTDTVDEITGLVKKPETLLAPIKGLTQDFGKVLEGIKKGGEEGAQMIKEAAENSVKRFESFYIEMQRKGVQIMTGSVNAASQVVPQVITAAANQAQNIPEQLKQIFLEKKTQEELTKLLENLSKNKDQLGGVAGNLLNDVSKAYQFYEQHYDELKKIMDDNNSNIPDKYLQILKKFQNESGINLFNNNTPTPATPGTVVPKTPENNTNIKLEEVVPTGSSSETAQLSNEVKQLKGVVEELIKRDQNIKIETHLDGRVVAESMVKHGLSTMLTNPNLSYGNPTLNPSSLNTRNGQVYANSVG